MDTIGTTETIIIFTSWIAFSVLVASMSKSKKIGFGTVLIWSLFVSPVIGLIIVLLSKDKPKINTEWKWDLKAAEEAALQKEYVKAIDLYMEALLHLKHDIEYGDNPNKESCLMKVDEVKLNIKELEEKVQLSQNE
jgi:hypothetical protein